MTNSLLSISSRLISIFPGVTTTAFGFTPGTLTTTGTMTGLESMSMICVRSAVAVIFPAFSRSTMERLASTITLTVSLPGARA